MENTEEKSPSQILNEAADLLEEEGRWSQGSYFKYNKQDGSACSMCAHGAIAYCGNSEVRKKVIAAITYADFDAATTTAAIGAQNAFAADAEHAAAAAAACATAIAPTAAAREGLTLEQYIYKRYKNVGVAHYRAVKAGLTFCFNDTPERTQREVVDKLREAAKQI